MGGRGKFIGAGTPGQRTFNAVQGGAGGAGETGRAIGRNVADLLGLRRDTAGGANPLERTTGPGNGITRQTLGSQPQPRRRTRTTGGGGGGGAAATPPAGNPRQQARAAVSARGAAARQRQAAAAAGSPGEASRFTAALEKEYGVGAKGRDAATAANWNGRFTVNESGGRTRESIRSLFGSDYSARDIGLLVGAPDGATVTVTGYGNSLTVNMAHPFFSGTVNRTVSRNSAGELVMSNDYFRKARGSSSPSDLGGRQLAIQTAVARKMGIKRIVTSAASGGSYNGYYTWARAGFNANLEQAGWKTGGYRNLPDYLKNTKDLNGLMKFDAVQRRLGHKIDSRGYFTSGRYKGRISGAQYWKENGEWSSMTFDLAPSSSSSKVLAYWQKEKGIFGARTQSTRGRRVRVTNPSSRNRRTRS